MQRVSHLHKHEAGLYTPLYYATELLRELRLSKTSYRVALRHRPGRKWLDPKIRDISPHVRILFGNEPNGRITPNHQSRLNSLSQWLDRNEDDEYPAIVLARVLARAIEEEYAATFWEQMRSYYNVAENTGPNVRTHALKEGDPVPVCNTIYAARTSGQHEFGTDSTTQSRDDNSQGRRGDYGTNPRSLPRWREPDRLSRVLLAPAGIEAFQVSLDFSLDSDLELLPLGRIATVHPTLDLQSDYCWHSDGHHLFDVRPRNETDTPPGPPVDDYLDRLKRSLEVSRKNQASLIVLPELSVTPEITSGLTTYWQEMIEEAENAGGRVPVILVAGSYHHDRGVDGGKANTATIISKAAICEIDKVVPYVQAEPDAVDGDLVEDIAQRRRPAVTIFCSERMTMVAFICVDYLLDPLRDLARDLDITLTVLPSMSAKSKVFAGLIAGHVAATQGAVVLANAVQATDDGSRGLIGHPAFPEQVLRLNNDFGVQPQGGVAVVDLRAPSASKWHPVTEAS
ncbi:MAG TPA: hypothetical protein VL068_03585 [Microthrixaceae bacterium]|nr:hypothetical protein [Microthrixaceae bacterium]